MESINQHKKMAMGEGVYSEKDFRVEPHDHTHKKNSEPKIGRKKHLADRERAIPTHRGYHPQPDHGPVE